VSKFGVSASNARGSATGTNSLELPFRAMRAGMTSCSWVAGRRSAGRCSCGIGFTGLVNAGQYRNRQY